MGTTATVVYLWKKEDKKFLQASNVGDSTAFLWYSFFFTYYPYFSFFTFLTQSITVEMECPFGLPLITNLVPKKRKKEWGSRVWRFLTIKLESMVDFIMTYYIYVIICLYVFVGLAVSRSLGNHFVKEQNIGMSSTPYPFRTIPYIITIIISIKYYFDKVVVMWENA